MAMDAAEADAFTKQTASLSKFGPMMQDVFTALSTGGLRTAEDTAKAKPKNQIDLEKSAPPEKVYGLLVVSNDKEDPVLHEAFIGLICFCCYSTKEKAQKALTANIVDQNFVDRNDCTLPTFDMEFVIKEMTFEEAVKIAKTKQDANNIAVDLNFGTEQFYKLENY
jgi:hypothetical protein